ncbi:MAG: hypothetical protein WCC60_18400 [Ilumatobacteraceae bacterium]
MLRRLGGLVVMCCTCLCVLVARPAADIASAAATTFVGLTPARLMDTRAGGVTVDGQFRGAGALAGGTVRDLVVLGRGGVPASGVNSVALNVTVTGSSVDSYLTVFPTGAARPTASNVNFSARQTIPNMVISQIGTGGQLSFFLFAGASDVLVDVLGYFPSGGGFTSVVPGRLMDTRPGGSTIDSQFAGVGELTAASVRNVTVTGRGGVPATGVGSVALNITATASTALSYLTVYPAGSSRPTASNLNLSPGTTIPNMVIVPVGAGGQISVYNDAGSTHVLVDVLGWFPAAGSSFTAINPYRAEDTRDFRGLIDRGVTSVKTTGKGGVPASGVSAVVLNVTVVAPSAPSYMTVWPSGAARPNASNLNFVSGQTVPNMVIVPVSPDGWVNFYNQSGMLDVLVDVLGYFTGAAYSPPPYAQFSCTTSLKNSLLNYLATDRNGAYTQWGWGLFADGFDQEGGELIVDLWNPTTGELVVTAVNDYGDGATMAIVNRTIVGELQYADGWALEDGGDTSLIYRSWWNTSRTINIWWAYTTPGSAGFPTMTSCV